MSTIKKPILILTLGKRLIFFICVTVFCMAIAGVISAVFSSQTVAALRIKAIVSDVLSFIIPALVTAILMSRTPATFLAIDTKIKTPQLVIAILTMVVAIPVMNWLVQWNECISLPQSMSGLEQWMRDTEELADKMIRIIQGSESTIGNLIMSIAVVGIMAGFSEEIFFRGTLLRLFTTANVNKHLAIWAVAFIFSALHFQFYGFFPRLLLAVYFGYLLCWTGCLWIPIIAHIFNNVLYVITAWMENANLIGSDINTIGTSGNEYVTLAISLVLTIVGCYALKLLSQRTEE